MVSLRLEGVDYLLRKKRFFVRPLGLACLPMVLLSGFSCGSRHDLAVDLLISPPLTFPKSQNAAANGMALYFFMPISSRNVELFLSTLLL